MTGRMQHRRQAGISLIVVLIALVIISFAALALLRSTDTATLIAGNLGFKKAALGSGDASNEAAATWLGAAVAADLFADAAGSGYYATSRDGCDLTGTRTSTVATDDVDWAGTGAKANCGLIGLAVTPVGLEAGYSARYVITRMCNVAGDPNALYGTDGVTPMICSRVIGTSSEGSTKSGGLYGNTPLSGSTQIYYRITTQITGPRNTVRFVQSFVVL